MQTIVDSHGSINIFLVTFAMGSDGSLRHTKKGDAVFVRSSKKKNDRGALRHNKFPLDQVIDSVQAPVMTI